MEMNLADATKSLISNCHIMLHQLLASGNKPLMYIMSPGTRKAIADLCPQLEPKRTWWQRAFRVKANPQIVNMAMFGVPILPNEFMPDGMVHLQALPRLDPAGFEIPSKGFIPSAQLQAQTPAQQQSQNQAQSPFWTGGQLAGAPVGPADAAPSLDDLSKGDGPRPSPTDVLIKAMGDAERVKHLAVLMIDGQDSIWASTNMDHTTLTGAIQKFQIWAHQQGGG